MFGSKASTTVTEFKKPDKRREDGHREIIIRPLPKFVFLYPTLLAAWVVAALTALFESHGTSFSIIFLGIFAMNCLVLALDFRHTSMLAVVLGIGFLSTLGFLINHNWYEFFGAVRDVTGKFSPHANAHFYVAIGTNLGLLFLIVIFIDLRLNYWKIMPNEIIHKHGLMDAVERFPAPGSRMQKDITDMLEFWLLKSGRLIIHPTKGEDIVLENVPFVNKVEERISTMLEATNVTVTDPFHHNHPHGE